jgi:predicted TIM-barrel fold metal-dependent hydrolase
MNPSTGSTCARAIDVHHHILPPAYIDAARRMNRLADVSGADAKRLNWTVADSLAAMDAAGIRTAIVSISTPGIWWGDAAVATDVGRACNEYAFELSREHPGRFGFFAALPLPDINASLAEIAYSFEHLGAMGVGLMTNYDARWPGDPAFAPVFEDLDRRNAVVFVHPTVAECCRGLIPGVGPSVIEYPLDTTRAITSLLASGTFARFPNIRWIFAHGGGAVPMLAARIARVLKTDPANVPNGALHELERIYFDVALATSRPAFAAMLAFTSVTNLLFGTDFPFMPVEDVNDGLRALALSADELLAIECRNARSIFGILED